MERYRAEAVARQPFIYDICGQPLPGSLGTVAHSAPTPREAVDGTVRCLWMSRRALEPLSITEVRVPFQEADAGYLLASRAFITENV